MNCLACRYWVAGRCGHKDGGMSTSDKMINEDAGKLCPINKELAKLRIPEKKEEEMPEARFLLTYYTYEEGNADEVDCFAWFKTEEDLNAFESEQLDKADENYYRLDAVEILSSREL